MAAAIAAVETGRAGVRLPDDWSLRLPLKGVPEDRDVRRKEWCGQSLSSYPLQLGCLIIRNPDTLHGGRQEHNADEVLDRPIGVAVHLRGGVTVNAQQPIDARVPASLLPALAYRRSCPRLPRLNRPTWNAPRAVITTAHEQDSALWVKQDHAGTRPEL